MKDERRVNINCVINSKRKVKAGLKYKGGGWRIEKNQLKRSICRGFGRDEVAVALTRKGEGYRKSFLKQCHSTRGKRQTGDGNVKQKDNMYKIFMKSHSASASVPV